MARRTTAGAAEARKPRILEVLAYAIGAVGASYAWLRTDDGGWLGWSVVAFSVLSIAGMLLPRNGIRFGYHVVLVAIGALSLDLWIDDRSQPRAKPPAPRLEQPDAVERENYIDSAIRTQIALKERWIDDIRSARARGGITEEPPLLVITETGPEVHVRNITTRPLCLDLRRRPATERVSSESCLLASSPDEPRCRLLKPGEAATFTPTGHPGQFIGACSGARLSYRVGAFDKPGIGWWSDGELEEFENEVEAEKEKFANQTHPYLTRPPSHEQIVLLERAREHLRRGANRDARWRRQLDEAEVRKWDFPGRQRAESAAETRRLEILHAVRKRLRELQSVRDALRASNAVAPSYLSVREREGRLEILSNTEETYRVRARRMGFNAAGGIESHCELTSNHVLGDGYVEIRPRETQVFGPEYGSACPGASTSLQLEVKDSTGKLIWMGGKLLDEELRRAEAGLAQLESER